FPDWTKRVGSVPPDRTHCPSKVGTLENLQGDSPRRENTTENVIKPALGTSFNSLSEFYDFYNLYSWENYFGIRYGKSRLNVTDDKMHAESSVCLCGEDVNKYMQQN
uniref:FAR1 domain-containing protein n=1 Tax=Aegilops tauschii subsp. strangulata TaxID=200361 RepID=A0A453SHJ8_AEGTS